MMNMFWKLFQRLEIINKLLIFFLLFSFFEIKAQNTVVVTYKAKMNQQLFDVKKEDSDKASYMGLVEDAIKDNPVEFELYVDSEASIYQIKKTLNQESPYAKIAVAIFGGQTKYYLNYQDREYFKETEAYGETFIIPIDKRTWEIQKEKKKIGKYLCQKAVTSYTVVNVRGEFEKNVTAWFTPELNFSYGPKGFFGLPGLIIELKDDKITYYSSNIKFNQKDVELKKPTKGKKVTQEEYDKIGMQVYEQTKER